MRHGSRLDLDPGQPVRGLILPSPRCRRPCGDSTCGWLNFLSQCLRPSCASQIFARVAVVAHNHALCVVRVCVHVCSSVGGCCERGWMKQWVERLLAPSLDSRLLAAQVSRFSKASASREAEWHIQMTLCDGSVAVLYRRLSGTSSCWVFPIWFLPFLHFSRP